MGFGIGGGRGIAVLAGTIVAGIAAVAALMMFLVFAGRLRGARLATHRGLISRSAAHRASAPAGGTARTGRC